MPILATKLYPPPLRSKVVLRQRLIARLNEGLDRKLTLLSAHAGFGKTTLVSAWIADLREKGAKACVAVHQVAWLSLDEGDNDPIRFLTYWVAALRTVAPAVSEKMLPLLQTPQPPSLEFMLTALLNEMAIIAGKVIFVLDDYHMIENKAVDDALTFLIDYLPPSIHLVIATREDPNLPLAHRRAKGQLSELRAADLCFTAAEAAEFLNQVMGLALSAEEISALERRTEGWIAGLQLAALSMQGALASGERDLGAFIEAFTGSHRFVLDYLVEEVLQNQLELVQTFLLRTAILDRLCAPLCAAVVGRLHPQDAADTDALLSIAQAQTILEALEHANLFIVPLDNERRWYRYHHLFAELLRQRLQQSFVVSAANDGNALATLHLRASIWYEEKGLEIEAFQHATAANAVDRADRLIEGRGIPLHLCGAVTMILTWLESLPKSVLNATPALWWRHASLLLVNGQTTGVEEKLQAAEDALPSLGGDEAADAQTRLLIGRIAAARAVLALTRYQVETMIAQSRRALEFLPATNRYQRTSALWTLGYAYLFAGDRAAARTTLMEAIARSQAAGDILTTILASIGLGNVQEADNELHRAAATYRHVLVLTGDQPLQIIYEAHLGLARIHYEWNDLAAAEAYGQQSLHLAQQYDRVIDRYILCEILLARLQWANGNTDGAAAMLAQSSQSAHQQNFVHRLPDVAAAQAFTLLRQGHVAAAADLARRYNLPFIQARVHLARGDAAAALTVLDTLRRQMRTQRWVNEELRVMVLQTLALHDHGEAEKARHLLHDVLTQTESAGFVRLYVDEGPPMAQILAAAAARGIMPSYVGKLLAAFPVAGRTPAYQSTSPNVSPIQPLVEPLSQRELEVLKLIAEGLSNQEISERLIVVLSTVKGHNQRIFGKLQVRNRTEAVIRARSLGLL